MNDVKRIKQLVKELNMYRNSYYNKSKSLVSDKKYDELFDELENLEHTTGIVLCNSPTQTVGYTVNSKLKKVTHQIPLLSLAKTKEVSELSKFINMHKSYTDFLLMLKLDGLTTCLTYKNGELIRAETRGDGYIGEDITDNALTFANIPRRIPYKDTLMVVGESIITYNRFNIINSNLFDNDKFKTPRNLVSGTVRQLDSGICAARKVKFKAFNVVRPSKETKAEEFDFLTNLGFSTVPYHHINLSDETLLNKAINNLKNNAHSLELPIDGLVLTINNRKYGESLGNTSHHFNNALAFKFYDEEIETTLREVEWSIGRNGILTPVAIFDTVDIDGTSVNRASIHNLNIINNLELGIGDTITVYKANQIIPQIKDNLTRSNTLAIPHVCPVCGCSTHITTVGNGDTDTKVLKCTNENCKGRLINKLVHFVSKEGINIDGLSEQRLTDLIERGFIRDFKDIYSLKNYREILYGIPAWGKKSVDKLLALIEKSKITTLDKFLNALGIPLIGKTASKKISNYFNGNYEKFIEAIKTNFDFSILQDFGSLTNDTLYNYFSTNIETVKTLSSIYTFKSIDTNTSNTLNSKKFVITGSLNHYTNRDELKKIIEENGGKVASSISHKTDYLINNDNTSNSSKTRKAKELNIPVITEEDFIKMVGDINE